MVLVAAESRFTIPNGQQQGGCLQIFGKHEEQEYRRADRGCVRGGRLKGYARQCRQVMRLDPMCCAERRADAARHCSLRTLWEARCKRQAAWRVRSNHAWLKRGRRITEFE